MAATLSVFGLMGGASLTEPVTFAGTGTTWLSSAPTFTITGTGNSIGTATVIDNLTAAATITCGATPGPFTITDSTTGATCTFTIATAATYDITDASVYGHYVQIEGEPILGTYSGGNTAWGAIYDGCIRFRGTIGQVDVFSANSQFYRLAIDGVMQNTGASLYIGGPAGFLWHAFATGLDASTEHEYMLWFGSVSGGSSFYVGKVRTFGGTGLNAASLSARPIVAVQGDSVTTGSGISDTTPNFDSTLCWVDDLGATYNRQVVNRSFASGEISGGNVNSVVNNTARITGLAAAPAAIYFLDGVVDVLHALDVTQFGTDYTTILTAWRAAWPSALIVCPKIQPNGPDSTSLGLVAPYNTKIAAAVAAKADPGIVFSTVIYDLVVASGLTGYHPHRAESITWAAAIDTELNGLLSASAGSAAQTEAHDSLAAPGVFHAAGSIARSEVRDILAIMAAAGTVAGSSLAVMAATERRDRSATTAHTPGNTAGRPPTRLPSGSLRWFPGLARPWPKAEEKEKERVR